MCVCVWKNGWYYNASKICKKNERDSLSQENLQWNWSEKGLVQLLCGEDQMRLMSMPKSMPAPVQRRANLCQYGESPTDQHPYTMIDIVSVSVPVLQDQIPVKWLDYWQTSHERSFSHQTQISQPCRPCPAWSTLAANPKTDQIQNVHHEVQGMLTYLRPP